MNRLFLLRIFLFCAPILLMGMAGASLASGHNFNEASVRVDQDRGVSISSVNDKKSYLLKPAMRLHPTLGRSTVQDYWLAQLTDADALGEASKEGGDEENETLSEGEGGLLRITVTGTHTPHTAQSWQSGGEKSPLHRRDIRRAG